MQRVLVTGANGFVGSAVCESLAARGAPVRAVARETATARSEARQLTVEQMRIGDIGPGTRWERALEGIGAVVHTAARVHVMRDSASDPLSEFRSINVAGTLALARQSVTAGVSRFIYLSSIKVNGEQTPAGCPFRPSDEPHPVDPYGISKCEAELALRSLAEETGLQVVIIRPVLVYGPGVKGNFRSMINWLRRGIPLPLGAIDNQRSFVGLANLVDLIMTCLTHPAATGQTFLVSDGQDLSTPELLRLLGTAMHRQPRLFPVPAAVLGAAASIVGRREMVRRLCESLQVDISRTRALLDWSPPVSVAEGLCNTVHSTSCSA